MKTVIAPNTNPLVAEGRLLLTMYREALGTECLSWWSDKIFIDVEGRINDGTVDETDLASLTEAYAKDAQYLPETSNPTDDESAE